MTTVVSSGILESNPNVWRVVITIPEGGSFADAVNLPLLRQEVLAVLAEGRLQSANQNGPDGIAFGFPTPPSAGEQGTLDGKVAAHNPEELTPEQEIAAYIRLDLDYKDVFFNASNILEVGIATLPEPVTLPAYRALLTSVLQSLASLAGTRFETHFNRERLAQGLPTTLPIGSMTLAQCAEFDELLHVWLNARKVDAINAQLTLGG